jgi:Fibronectin type III domain
VRTLARARDLGDGSAAVFFKPPTDTGGSPVIAYQVVASNGATATVTGRQVLLGKEECVVFRGLTNGTPYTFTVAAVTVAGTGAAVTSAPVTPGST